MKKINSILPITSIPEQKFCWLVLPVMFRGVKRHNIFVQTHSVFEMFSFSKNPVAPFTKYKSYPEVLAKIFKESNRKSKD